MHNFVRLWQESGLYSMTPGALLMILVGLLLLFLAIRKGFEPLLLVPIGFSCILANIPGAGLAYPAVENALAAGQAQTLQALAEALGADVGARGAGAPTVLRDAGRAA